MQPRFMANAFDGDDSGLEPDLRALSRRRERVLAPSYRLFYRHPVAPVRAEGVWLYDAHGQRYLDAYNNVPAVGHSNPHVQRLVTEQLATLNTHTRYLTAAVIDYSERLLDLFPAPLSKVVYTCTGSEAVDLALRMARYQTGQLGVICTSHAYHGTTASAAEISPSLGPNNPTGSHVELIDAPDLCREDPALAGQLLANRVRTAIAALSERGLGLAAMIVDSVMSSDGVQSPPGDLLGPSAEVVHRAGGLWIADEVQPGFGRLGHDWWGFTQHALEPDLVVLGKPMGNGIPIAAVVGTEQVMDRFGRDIRYFNTFAGNPVSIAAATAVLDVIEDDDLIGNAHRTGDHLLAGLRDLADRHESLGHVRGSGLFVAAELVTDPMTLEPDPHRASKVVNDLRDRGVLISVSGPSENVLKIRPPLPFGLDHADHLLSAMDKVLMRAS